MLTSNKPRFLAGVVAIVALLSACEDDGVGPEEISREDVVRAFSAETFTTTTDGATTDHLSQGATLTITLHADGTTAGRLFVPGGAEDGSDFDADLEGTFSFDDSSDRVTFEQDADTFVRDMPFTAVRSAGVVQLEGEETFGGTTVRVVWR